MIILIGTIILYGLIAIAIVREPGGESGSAGGGYGNGTGTGSGAYHQ